MSRHSGNTTSNVAYHPFFQQKQKKLEQHQNPSSTSSSPPTHVIHTPSPPPPPPSPKAKSESTESLNAIVPAATKKPTSRPRGRPRKIPQTEESEQSTTASTPETTPSPQGTAIATKSTRALRTSKKSKLSFHSPELVLATEAAPEFPKKTIFLPHVPAVASGSTPRCTPMIKPKFYSDTLEYKAQQEYEAQFNFWGRIPSASSTRQKNKYDHEFSRLDRKIFGNAHITQLHPLHSNQPALKEEAATPYMNAVKKKRDGTSLAELIQTKQTEFFQLGKRLRRPSISNKRSSDRGLHHSHFKTQAQLEEYLDVTFPYWHTFSSCVILSQLVFNKKNIKQVHQQQPWIDKYRPKSVNGLLGDRSNHVYLKDWLHQMKIEPIVAPLACEGRKKAVARRKKKKKKVLEIDLDFNDLSLREDDVDDDDFMPATKSAKQLKRESMKSNMILITGDHGIGKTACVYTAAEQLGYEVFEINSGTKRSGKEVNSTVGEMSRSHLVSFGMSPFMLQQQQKKIKEQDAKMSTKRKLNPYLSSKAVNQIPATISQPTSTGFLKSFLRKKDQEPTSNTKKRQTTTEPKQSLILLEEVDVLFEEDKAFWTSVIELSQKSKRPIIMTCNDPDQIPFENLYLQVILDMKPPSEAELLPYLWLICFSEGYLVDPSDLICFMAFLGRDIRQLIQTLELYVKEDHLFQHYLNLHPEESLVDTKLKCVPSRVAVDTFRLARYYRQEDKMVVDDEAQEDLYKIEKALEDNAFIDTWLSWKENGNMIHEQIQDQINGFTNLEYEDDDENESKLILKDLESTVIVLNSQQMTTSTWNSVLCDESSRWDEICDAKFNHFDEYTEAIAKLLTERLFQQPNEEIIMMEYIPYIQQMLDANSKTKQVKTRSKRKRLYLPLNDESVDILTLDRPIVDETEFWIDRLRKLKKEYIGMVAEEEDEELLEIA